MTLVDILGWSSSALVLATFYLRTMIPLRLVAMASNIAFASYGMLAGATPIVVLHCLLLPLNALRFWQMRQLIRRVKRASRGDLSVDMLIPFMQVRTVPAGTTLFARGDFADHVFLILKGRVRIVGAGALVSSGQLVGEMGLFSPNRERTDTAVAETEVELASVSDDRMWELIYQNPEFGGYLLRIIMQRMTTGRQPGGPPTVIPAKVMETPPA